jgi:hypothetical protein
MGASNGHQSAAAVRCGQVNLERAGPVNLQVKLHEGEKRISELSTAFRNGQTWQRNVESNLQCGRVPLKLTLLSHCTTGYQQLTE